MNDEQTPQTDAPAEPPVEPSSPAAPDAPAADPGAPPTRDPGTPAAPAPADSPSDPAPAQPVTPGDATAGNADLGAQIDALRNQITELEQRTNSGQLTLAQTDQELASKVEDLRSRYEEWPQRGGGDFDTQPWDLQGNGLPQPGVTRDHLPGGAPDEISPVVVGHSQPILEPGTAGPPVQELARLLHKSGYATSISAGRNHASAFEDTVSAAVQSFKRDFHVSEDPSQFRDERQAETAVGPYIWEALIRAAGEAGLYAAKALL